MEATPPADPDPAPGDIILYIATYKVVVCKLCKYAIQPTGISGHLKDIHNFRHSQRLPVVQFVSKLDLAPPDVVLKTDIVQFPVPGLDVHQGVKCQADGCEYLSISEKRMKGHWYSAHGRPGEASVDWHPAPLQTMFRGNLVRYFTYSASNGPPADSHCPLVQDPGKQDEGGELDDPGGLIAMDTEVVIPPNMTEADLMLLKQYMRSTSMTLATNRETQLMWQSVMPIIACQYPFLMHGLLAVTSLHLAYLYPEQAHDYTIVARCHQNIAMPQFRSAIAGADAASCHACLAFSHLLVVYSWASEKLDGHLFLVEEGEDVLPPWLYFLRNGCASLCHVWDNIKAGHLRRLASQWNIPAQIPKVNTYLVINLFSVVLESSSPEAWPEDEVKIYRDAATELGKAFACTPPTSKYTTWDALRVWPMHVSADFFALLQKWHPGALILLAHYCILLQRVEKNWYFEGRASKLLSTILRHLDPKWHRFIKWPLEEILDRRLSC